MPWRPGGSGTGMRARRPNILASFPLLRGLGSRFLECRLTCATPKWTTLPGAEHQVAAPFPTERRRAPIARARAARFSFVPGVCVGECADARRVVASCEGLGGRPSPRVGTASQMPWRASGEFLEACRCYFLAGVVLSGAAFCPGSLLTSAAVSGFAPGALPNRWPWPAMTAAGR